jgi:hypothetical protein
VIQEIKSYKTPPLTGKPIIDSPNRRTSNSETHLPLHRSAHLASQLLTGTTTDAQTHKPLNKENTNTSRSLPYHSPIQTNQTNQNKNMETLGVIIISIVGFVAFVSIAGFVYVKIGRSRGAHKKGLPTIYG